MGWNCAAGKLAGSNFLLEFSVFIGGQLWANKLHSWEWFIHAISGTIGDGLSLGFAPWIGIGYPKTGDAVAPSSPSQQDHPNLGEHEKRTIETTQLFTFHHNHQGILQSANLRYPANKNGWVSAVLWRKNQLQLLYRYGKLPTSPDFQIPNETNWVSRLRDIQPEGLGRRTVPCTVRLCKILVVVLTEIWGTPHAPNISSPQKLRDVLALLIFQGPLQVLVKSPQLG